MNCIRTLLSRCPALLSIVVALPMAVAAGQPGLDGPVAIGPYLNGAFPAVEATGASVWTVQETYQGININLPMDLRPYPGTNKLLCVAKEGRILLFDDDPAATTTDTFLDLRGKVFTSSDCGMTWLVFHPDFGKAGSPNRGYVYVTYKWRPSGTGIAAGNGSEAFWRVSRFTVPDGTRAADPASERVLIQQYDRQQFHDSGCMAFGADGYLYVGIGDEGGANDEYNVGQKINARLFSGILRIDVDGRATSHAIRRQPAQLAMPAGWPPSATADYKIPADNPFNKEDGSVLEEFFAIGVRQPYRFSQDPVTGLLWLADSGQDTREELDIVTAGANFGWPFREGKIARPTGPQPPAVPATILGTLTEPVWDVAHGTDNCIVGGFVYRGAAHPSLVGKFLTVDNVTGHIRAHVYDGTVATNELLTDMPSGSVYSGTSTIGRDAAGEPIFVKINGTGTRGRFFRLATISATTTRSGWFRLEDRAAENATGYVADNPQGATGNSVAQGVPLVAPGTGPTVSNVTFNEGSDLSPTGFPANAGGVHLALANGTGPPGNANGELATGSKLGALNDFTIELSFRPDAGSLGSDYQTFLGLHGTTGTAPTDGEAGPPLQPFRLMRWGRNDTKSTSIPLENGDLYLNVRTLDPATNAWTSVPVEVLDKTAFTAGKWYHLAIVGSAAAGTVTVYSYEADTGGYVQLAENSGYAGNLQAGIWTVGRGAYNGAAADWVRAADFDEIRISNSALLPAQFLYGDQPTTLVIPRIDPPPLLSQTGAFTDLATLTPAPGIVPYSVNAPLWSDGAAKKRWLAVPNDGSHNTPAETISFLPEGSWKFPVGTVFIKHFELPVDDTDPAVLRRLETRFIVMPAIGEPYGLTYRWRPDGSDAELLPDGMDENIAIATADGGTRQETWSYPSRNECRVCHNGNAGHILGVRTQQLNGDFTYPATGRTANQLETLGALGWFSGNYRGDLVPWMLKSYAVADATASLGDRVRSYLDSNCSQCHQPGGVRAYFDARYTTSLENQGLIHGELETSYGDALNRVIVPGDPARSILLRRLSSVAEIKMPPIAKHLVDQPAVQLLTDWIGSLGSGPSVALSAGSTPSGPFMVSVHFSQDVSGLALGDFQIAGGRADSLTGSGADYSLFVVPASSGRVTVTLPAGSASNAAGGGNYASADFAQNVTDLGFAAWLKLDDGSGTIALDSTASGSNSGTLVNMEPADWIAGRTGGALAFDNSDERVTMPNVLGADFTISFWMRTGRTFPLSESASGGAVIFHADVPGAARDFIIAGTRSALGVNRVTFQTGSGNNIPNSVLHGTAPVNTGEWTHIAITRTQASGEMKIHVNGALQATAAGSTKLLTANPAIAIGATPGQPALSYEGDLDDIRLYTRVLELPEIVALESEPAADPYETWVRQQLPGIYHLQSPDQDPERDGLTNFAEFAFGGNPLVPDAIPVPLERAADGAVTLSYRARKAPAGAAYRVLVTTDLATWTDAAADITAISTEAIADSDYQWVDVTYMPPPGADARFFRIEAKPE